MVKSSQQEAHSCRPWNLLRGCNQRVTYAWKKEARHKKGESFGRQVLNIHSLKPSVGPFRHQCRHWGSSRQHLGSKAQQGLAGARLEAKQCGGHAKNVDPAACLQSIHDITLSHSAQFPLQVPSQPPGQPRVAKGPECAHEARHNAEQRQIHRHCRAVLHTQQGACCKHPSTDNMRMLMQAGL